MSDSSLATVLRTLSRAEKLAYLERLHPSDAAAIELAIDDCIAHRWPKTTSEWFAAADRLAVKH